MIDLHCHLLPGVDDGVQTMDATVVLAREALAIGIQGIVATPHVVDGVFNNSRDTILVRLEEVNRLLKQHGLSIDLYPGAEYFLQDNLLHHLRRGSLMTINDQGKHLLIELPTQEVPSYAFTIFFHLQMAGITPIIAHPERNRQLAARPDDLHAFIERGVLVQITAGSPLGLFGTGPKKASRYYLSRRWVHFIGSDAHGVGRRLRAVAELAECFEDHVPAGYVEALLYDNPMSILEGVSPQNPAPSTPGRAKSRFIR